MAWTTTDLAAIDAAIASGVKEVHYQDRRVVYQTMQELRMARADILLYLSQQNTSNPMIRTVRVYTNNGW